MKRRWKIGYIFEVKVWKIGSDQETFHFEFLVPSLPRREHDPEESPPPYYRCTRAWRVSWPREESTSRVIGIPRAPLWVALILDVIHGILVSDRPGIPIFSHAGRIPDQQPLLGLSVSTKISWNVRPNFPKPALSILHCTKGKFIAPRAFDLSVHPSQKCAPRGNLRLFFLRE